MTIYKDGKLAGSPATSPGTLYRAYDIMPVADRARQSVRYEPIRERCSLGRQPIHFLKVLLKTKGF